MLMDRKEIMMIDLRTAGKAGIEYKAQLERKEIQVGNITRYVWLYIGKVFVVANPVVFVYAPAGENIQEFAEKTGWLKEADRNGNVLVFPEPEEEWDISEEKDLQFWDAIKNISDIRFKSHNTRQYICGYQDGAAMVEKVVLHSPEFFGGISLINPPEVGRDVLEAAGQEISTEYIRYNDVMKDYPVILSKDVEQNILLITEYEGQLTETIAFWKSVGNGKNPYAGVIVCAPEGWDAQKVYSDFFSRTRRYRIAPNGELREASDYRDNPNAKRYYEKLGTDVEREWIEVLPSDYDAAVKIPLVIALHGSNNDGAQFYDITRLWEISEARKCIVLFPTALRSEKAYEAWNFYSHTPKDNGNDDESFLLALIRKYQTEYSGDPSRTYLTGFSNGGGMVNWMTMNHPELFAAVMPYSGAHKTPEYYTPFDENSILVPYWMNRGEFEYKPSTLSMVVAGKEQWEYWKKRNGLAAEPDLTIENTRTRTEIYSGRVETRYTKRKLAHHAILSEQYWDIYDNFFIRFCRGEHGESIEDGYTHIAKLSGRNVLLRRSKRIDGHIYICAKEAETALKHPVPECEVTGKCMIDGEAYYQIS